MEDETFWAELGRVFFIVLIIGSIFEVGLLIFAYVNADEVECNLLWCTFTTEFTSHESTKNITTKTISTSTRNCYESTRNCYENNIKINCSEVDKMLEKYGIE